MISEKNRFIFIHVPKTAGNSIQTSLLAYSEDRKRLRSPNQDGINRFDIENLRHPNLWKHSTLESYASCLGDAIRDYLIFTVIRNPYDKILSHYFSPHRGEIKWDPGSFNKFLPTVKPLEHYTRVPEETRSVDLQITYLRFENLQDDFSKLLESIGLPQIELGKFNIGPARPRHEEFYSEEAKKYVEEHHALELTLGKYTFAA